MDRTLILVKPDAFARRLTGEIITRFERKGLQLAAMRLMTLDEQTARRHYAEHEGQSFFDDLVAFITSGPVAAFALEGPDVIAVVRRMVGATMPNEAEPGTIRGDLGVSGLRNLIHASDAPGTAESELALWFGADALVGYEREIDAWIVAEEPARP